LSNIETSKKCYESERLYKLIQLLGDPELSIYTDMPLDMNVIYDPEITAGNSNYDVTVSGFPAGEEVKICLYKENEVHVATETSTGLASFNITPDTQGEMNLTVTCHNAEPYETIIEVTQDPGIHLYETEVTIYDDDVSPSNGNSDGLADAGEIIEIFVELTNSGQIGTTYITAELSYIDPELNEYIVVTGSQSSINNGLGSGQSGILSPAFVINISEETPDLYYATFELNITDGQQNTYQEEIQIIIHAPDVKLFGNSFTTDIYPEDDIDPDDIVEVTFEIYNKGTGLATGISGVITESSDFIDNISEPNQEFGDISSHESVINQDAFKFHVVDTYSGETIEIDLTLTDEFGNEWEIPVNFDKPGDITNIKWSSTQETISLSWNPLTGEKGYNVYRSNAEQGVYEKVNSQLIEGYSGYTDYGLLPQTIYYYKICCVSNSGLEGDLSVPVKTWTILQYHTNWPKTTIKPDVLGSRTEGSPMTADFNADGNKEIYVTTTDGGGNVGAILGFYHNGEEIYDIDQDPESCSGFYKFDGAGSSSTPVIGDINNNNNFEILTTTLDGDGDQKRKLVIHSTIDDPQNPDGLPDFLNDLSIGGPELKGAVLSDIDKNGSLEILVKAKWGAPLYVLNGSDWSFYPDHWPVEIDADGYSMPVAADIDNIGNKEIIIGYKNNESCDAGIYVYKSNGESYTEEPNGLLFQHFSTETGTYDRMDSPVSIINIDGYNRIVCVSGRVLSNHAEARVFILNDNGGFIPNWEYDKHKINVTGLIDDEIWLPATSIGDISEETGLEIVIAGKEQIHIWNENGNDIIDPIDLTGLQSKFTAPLLADIDEDDDIEIIVASNGPNGNIYCYNIDGSEVIGWPLALPRVFSTPCIDDIDNDGKNEIIATSGAEVYVWDTEGDADKIEWGKYRHDRYNSGIYGSFCPKSATPIIVSGVEEWTDNKILQSDIIIETNGKLSIFANIALPENAKIIVKPGAELIVDGGMLINSCDNSWQGIQVWGNSAQSQYCEPGQTCEQGKLTLKNSAVIENAVVAVDLWNPGDWSSTGGIVYADSAVFRNNAKSVHALYYRNFNPYFPGIEWDYFSYFKNCTFEITSAFNGDVIFNKHVDLAHVKGIDFSACDFSLADNVIGVDEYNSAIYSNDAGFSVLPLCTSSIVPCPEYDSCIFTGFYRAINATSDLSTTHSFHVNSAVFNNNTIGVEINQVNNVVVLFSNFNIGVNNTGDKTNYDDASGTGISINNATGFAIEENSFTKNTGAPNENYIGISIYNTMAADEVYKNYFNGLSYANYSDGQNWNSKYIWEGLAYYCNENMDNYADFFVAEGDHSGIQSMQGNSQRVTGNKFSSTGATWHFFNGGDYQVLYYYCDYCPDENPDDNLIYDVIEMPENIENTCQSHYADPNTPLVMNTQQTQQAEIEYYTNLTDYNDVKSLYQSLTDGGDTEEELIDIQIAQAEDMWDLRSQLLGDSPHLSQEALMETSDRTDIFPDDILMDILSANPDELKKDTLLSYLENKEDPLPDYMINILRQVASGTTYKTVLQQQMARYNRNKTRVAHNIIRSILYDTIIDFTELRNWLDNLGGISADRQIISTYLQQANFADAHSLADMLPQLYDLQGDDLTEHNYYVEILDLHDSLNKQNRYIFQLDSTEIANLVIIADSSKGVSGAQAKGILESCYGYHFTYCPILEGNAGYKNNVINMKSLVGALGLDITVKPNPAQEWAAFDYTLPKGESEATITITDIVGKTIVVFIVNGQQGQKIWDTRNIDNGIYIYTLKTAGLIKSGKIIVNN